MKDWVIADSGAVYPTVLSELPDPLPFTAKDADIWYETTVDSPGLKSVLAGIMNGCSFRAARMLMGYGIKDFDVSSTGSTISHFAYCITKKIDKPKIYVRIGTH